MDVPLTWTDCDVAGDYVVSNVLRPRDLVSGHDNMDETVLHKSMDITVLHTSQYLLLCKVQTLRYFYTEVST